MLVSYWLLTRCKEQRDPSHAGLHELSVDALHVSGRQAVFIVPIADGVNPGQVRHVAKQHHPLEERFLRLVTTCRLTRKRCSVSCNMLVVGQCPVLPLFFLYFSSPHGRWIRACLYLVSESPSGSSPAVLPRKEGGATLRSITP